MMVGARDAIMGRWPESSRIDPTIAAETAKPGAERLLGSTLLCHTYLPRTGADGDRPGAWRR
eukprot:6765762-Prymnesium_polylepis.1